MWIVTLIVVAYIFWLVFRMVAGFIMGFLVGRELRTMRSRGIDASSHPVFQDPNWGKYFQGVKKQIQANPPKVTVIVDEPLCLSARLDRIQDGWKK